MGHFLSGSVLPFGAISTAIVGLTMSLFDVPKDAPVVFTRSPELTSAGSATMNDALAKAFRALDTERRRDASAAATTTPSPTIAPTAVTPPAPPNPATNSPSLNAMPSPAPDIATMLGGPVNGGGTENARTAAELNVLKSVNALADAVKAIRDARNEDDIVHAEDQMRAARVQMEATCASGGPLCDSAREVKSIGF